MRRNSDEAGCASDGTRPWGRRRRGRERGLCTSGKVGGTALKEVGADVGREVRGQAGGLTDGSALRRVGATLLGECGGGGGGGECRLAPAPLALRRGHPPAPAPHVSPTLAPFPPPAATRLPRPRRAAPHPLCFLPHPRRNGRSSRWRGHPAKGWPRPLPRARQPAMAAGLLPTPGGSRRPPGRPCQRALPTAARR